MSSPTSFCGWIQLLFHLLRQFQKEDINVSAQGSWPLPVLLLLLLLLLVFQQFLLFNCTLLPWNLKKTGKEKERRKKKEISSKEDAVLNSVFDQITRQLLAVAGTRNAHRSRRFKKKKRIEMLTVKFVCLLLGLIYSVKAGKVKDLQVSPLLTLDLMRFNSISIGTNNHTDLFHGYSLNQLIV